MAIGSETPTIQEPLNGASAIHEFLSSSPARTSISLFRSRPLPPRIQLTSQNQSNEPMTHPLLPKDVSKSLQKLNRLGSRKRNRLRNQKELLESSPVSGKELLRSVDWDLGYSSPRPDSAFLKVLQSPQMDFVESIGDILEESNNMTPSKANKNGKNTCGQENLSAADKGLRQNLRRCLYGKDEMIQFERQIREWLKEKHSDTTRVKAYCVEDKLMRLLIHALCRFYGLSSYSEP